MNTIFSGFLMFTVTLPLLLSLKIWTVTEEHKAIIAQALRVTSGFIMLGLLGSGLALFFEATNGEVGIFHAVLLLVAFFVLSFESAAMLVAFGSLFLFGTIFTSGSLDILGTISITIGFLLGCFTYNKLDDQFVKLIDKYLNIQKDKDGLTDIRTLKQNQIEQYDLQEQLDPESIFLGMGEESQPVKIGYKKFKETNFQIIGYPGAGKGVFAQMVLSQVKNRIAVFDPKNDKYLTAMFANDPNCQFIWLNSDVPQLSIFKGATELEIINALIEALSMKEKGTDSDVYTLEEQEIIRKVVSEGSRNFDSWLELAESEHSRSRKVIARFQALTRYGCIKGTDSIIDRLEKGNLYIIFDESDETQKIIARLIFARLCQVKRANQFSEQLTLFCDEFIHLVNKSSVNALGLLRSHMMNFIIAHQSLGDFEANFPDVESKEALQRTLDNTQVKVVYKQLAEAKYWSEMTGTKLYEEVVKDETAIGIRQKFGGVTGKTRIEQKELIDINEFQSLRKNIAVMIGHDLPRKILTTVPMFDTSTAVPKPTKAVSELYDIPEIVDLA